MANLEDLDALRAGATDLIGRDFRDADLSYLQARDCDFSRARIDKANFTKASLEVSKFLDTFNTKATFDHANLQRSVWKGGIVRVSFKGADLRFSNFSQCVFEGCDFSGADLRSANFSDAVIRESNLFKDTITDELTLFDRSQSVRSIAREKAFQHFVLERGELRRKSLIFDKAELAGTAERHDLMERTDELLRALQQLEPAAEPRPEGIGHNNPPEETPLDRAEYDTLTKALQDLKVEIPKAEPDVRKMQLVLNAVTTAGSKTLSWIGRKFDLAADEAVKETGKLIPKLGFWAFLGTSLYNALQQHAQSLLALLKALGSGAS